jgi:GT2 family glycosyltransferase
MLTEANPVAPFSVVARSGASAQPSAVVVCILTRARPEFLRRTLASLAEQSCPHPFVCVVADNDAQNRAGAAVAKTFFDESRLAGAAVVVHEPGHCVASNSAFAAARALFPEVPLVAMIDDDEIAEPSWLAALLDAQARTGVDLVGGPVLSHFERADADHYAGHPVFNPFFTRSGPVPFLYGSGNFLVRAAVLDRVGQPLFDPAFNFTGGGDFDFFLRCRALGFTAWFAADATCTESVPAARTTPGWVLARSLRYGTINHMIETRAARTRRAALTVPLKSAALLALAPLRGTARLLASGNLLQAAHPVMEALGRILAPFGVRPEQYRTPR